MSIHQLSFAEVDFQERISNQPKRIAYIDESGSFGFDFAKKGTSKYYILTAIVIESDYAKNLCTELEEIKKRNGYGGTELKSSKVSDKTRARIMMQLLPLSFRIVLFIADKEAFKKGTPLADYKTVFLKNMNSRMHLMLYHAYPRLKIMMDSFGYPEFQDSFRKYVEEERTQLNLFNEYDFDFVDSKDETLIQIADFISGSINKNLVDPDNTPNYLEILRGKITALKRFPQEREPYWGHTNPADLKYDKDVYMISVKSAEDFIAKHSNEKDDDRKAQVAVLEYLLFYVTEVSSSEYVYADTLVNHLQPYIERHPTKDYLFRRVIAPLRDSGVLLASCARGYKIPISVDDIVTYMNQTTSTAGPMINRMGLCRNIILQGTDNTLDIFDDEAFIRYKRFFE